MPTSRTTSSRTHFPHISRFITAVVVKSLVLTIFGSFLYLNFISLQEPRNPLWPYQIGVIEHNDSSSHKQLAKELWLLGQWQLTNQELALSETNGRKADVLGVQTAIPAEWTAEKSQLEARKQKLFDLTRQKPDYRDGMVELIKVHYALGELDDALALALKVQRLDPQYLPIQRVIEVIQNQKN